MTPSLSGRNWEILPRPDTQSNLHPIIANILCQAGITDTKAFLSPNYFKHSHSPTLFRDMKQAVARIKEAVNTHETIILSTDFDADGGLSCRMLIAILQLLGVKRENIHFYIGDRFTEGYGFNANAIEFARKLNAKLIITADIGVTAHTQCTLAKSLDIDVIIIDHHLPDGSDVPTDAHSVICPKGSSKGQYPNPNLAAVGVTLKLGQALLKQHPKYQAVITSLCKLAAIGTIADMVSLADPENRAIVATGLKALSTDCKNPGLQALLGKTTPTASHIAFQIAPRINAAGRIEHANLVVQLLEERDPIVAIDLATKLNELNTERKAKQKVLTEQILGKLPNPLPSVIVVGGTEEENFHKGVLGLAATRITNETGKPSFVYSVKDGVASGSTRGVNGYHVVAAMNRASHLLTKFGGHPAAGGFTLPAANLPSFTSLIQTDQDFKPSAFTITDELNLSDVTTQFIETLSVLEPHGFGFPAPIFLLPNYRVCEIAPIKEQHLRITLTDGHSFLNCIWWGAIQHIEKLRGKQISVIGRPEINAWKGKKSVQFQILDARVNTTSCADSSANTSAHTKKSGEGIPRICQ